MYIDLMQIWLWRLLTNTRDIQISHTLCWFLYYQINRNVSEPYTLGIYTDESYIILCRYTKP